MQRGLKTMARKLIVLAVGLLMLLGLATVDLQGSKTERHLFLDMSRRELSGTPSGSNSVSGSSELEYYSSSMSVKRLDTRRMLRPTPSGKRPPPPKPHRKLPSPTPP